MFIFEVQYYNKDYEEGEDRWFDRTILAHTWEGALRTARKYEQDSWELCHLRKGNLVDDVAEEEVSICQQ
jgi:hypothetical protein